MIHEGCHQIAPSRVRMTRLSVLDDARRRPSSTSSSPDRAVLAALEREIKLGTLRTAAAALVHHWRPLVHGEGSEAYEARTWTLERAEDRVDGACFVLSRSVSLEDAMPHDVRDELVGGGVPRLQTTPARVASDAPPSWRLAELKKRRSLM